MGASADNAYLVSFENVSASIAGIDISSFTELQLSATANGIPRITLLVVPDMLGADMTAVLPGVSLRDARTFIDLFSPLVKQDGAELSLSITVRARGGSGEDTQSLSISGWILTDVALAPIQHGGVCTVALTCMHPVCKSDFGGVIPSLLTKPPAFDAMTSTDPVSLYVEALGVYGSEAARDTPRESSVSGASSTEEVQKRLLEHLATAASNFSSTVSWTGGGLPASGTIPDNYIGMGIAQAYASPTHGTSVFQRFAKGLVPECSLSLGGDYASGMLEVKPFTPWEAASVSISDSDILTAHFPQTDPTPISGVQLIAYERISEIPNSFNIEGAQAVIKPVNVYYVPTSELDAPYLYGGVQQFQEPGWLATAGAAYGIATRGNATDTVSMNNGTLKTAATVGRNDDVSLSGVSEGELPSTDYSDAAFTCAKAYYETSLMKDWAFNITTRLMFSGGGSRICPARVLDVTSGGSSVIGGYIIGVEHTISVASRVATTVITCTHPRFGGIPDGISSTSNALYS